MLSSSSLMLSEKAGIMISAVMFMHPSGYPAYPAQPAISPFHVGSDSPTQQPL